MTSTVPCHKIKMDTVCDFPDIEVDNVNTTSSQERASRKGGRQKGTTKEVKRSNI